MKRGRTVAAGRKKAQPRRRAVGARRWKRAASLLLCLCLVAALLVFARLWNSRLPGALALDGNTVYKFDGGGSGTLRLPLGSYPFRYTVEGDRLTIDFADAAAADAAYRFHCAGRSLTLESKTGAVYTLTRQEKGL